MNAPSNRIPAWAKGISVLALALTFYLGTQHTGGPRFAFLLIACPAVVCHAALSQRSGPLWLAALGDLVFMGAMVMLAMRMDRTLLSWPMLPWWVIGLWIWPGSVLHQLRRRIFLRSAVLPAGAQTPPLASHEPSKDSSHSVWIELLRTLGRTVILTLAVCLGFALPSWTSLPDWTLVLFLIPAFLAGYRWFDGPLPVWPYAVPPVVHGTVLVLIAMTAPSWVLPFVFIWPSRFLNQLMLVLTGIPRTPPRMRFAASNLSPAS